MNNHTVRRSIESAIAVLLLATVAFPFQMDQKFARTQEQNAQALRLYAWKSRTEVQKSGETRNVQLALMRYDNYGTVQKTPISSTPQRELPPRGIRRFIAEKKKESFMETLDDLGKLARSYSELRPDQMQRFTATAVVTPEMAQQQKLFRITGSNVLQPGDSMTFWVDAVTHKPRRVEIRTALERKAVSIVSDFQDLPNGPNYMSRSVVDYPSEELRLVTENFDYQREMR